MSSLMHPDEAKRIADTMNEEQRALLQQMITHSVACATSAVNAFQERDSLKQYVNVVEDASRQKSEALTMATQAARAFQDETHQARADMAEQARIIAALERTINRLRDSYREWTHGKNPTGKAAEEAKAGDLVYAKISGREPLAFGLLCAVRGHLIELHQEIVRMNRRANCEWFSLDLTKTTVELVRRLTDFIDNK